MRPLLLWLASASFGLAQAVALPPVSSMTPETLEKTISECYQLRNDASTPDCLFAEAIAIGRLDLIKACLLNRHVSPSTFRALVALPDNDSKLKTSVMMLRMPTLDCWPVLYATNTTIRLPDDVTEPFISTVAKLLPGEVLTKEMLATQPARDQLADKLLVMLMARKVTIREEERALLEPSPAPPAPSQGERKP